MTDPVLPPGLEPNESVCQMLAAAGVMSPAECQSILDQVQDDPPATGAVLGVGGGVTGLRDSDVRWLPRSESTEWVHTRIYSLAQQLNESFFKFDLRDMEPFQVARYAGGGEYGWHMDLGPGRATLRKLTVVVQLSDPADYEGGELEFPDVVGPITKERGAAVIFPSFLRHKVHPVTKGERFSIAGWFVGPPYR